MSAEVLSAREVALAQAKSIVRSAGRALFRRVRRDRGHVAGEYDGGHWARMLETRPWESAGGLEEFLIGKSDQTILAKVDGRATRLTQREYYRYRIRAQAELVRNELGASGDLVEIGAGYGANLFALALALPERRFIGLDISPNGIAAGRAIAAHFGLESRVRFEALDLTDPNARAWPELAGRDCFSFFCLEQIPYDISTVISRIAAARPRRVLHVEPTVELLDLSRPADWANYAYVKSVDYQTELFGVLDRMNREGAIRLLRTGRVGFAPTLQNDGFTALWEPCKG